MDDYHVATFILNIDGVDEFKTEIVRGSLIDELLVYKKNYPDFNARIVWSEKILKKQYDMFEALEV
jgi:hypothetical protein